jgi:hypothetical protein
MPVALPPVSAWVAVAPLRLPWLCGCAALCLLVATLGRPETLPYGPSTNPFIWDNDTDVEAFTQEFVMALANTGTIRLLGITLSPNGYSTGPEDLQAYVVFARRSGLRNIPDAKWNLGPYDRTALSRPSSSCELPATGSPPDACIDGTKAIDTEASRWIKDQVLTAGTASRPVVVGAGGPLTTIASAYLLARAEGRGPEFASKVAVYANIGRLRSGRPDIRNGYNNFQDGWATFVCLQRLKVVIVDTDHSGLPISPSEIDFIRRLPSNDLTSFMRSKFEVRTWPYPEVADGDADTVLAFLHPTQGSYFNNVARVGFARFTDTFTGSGRLNDHAYQRDLIIAANSSSDDLYVWNFQQSVALGTWEDALTRGIPGGRADGLPPRVSGLQH